MGFGRTTLEAVDQVVGAMVKNAYQHIVQGYSSQITLAFTLYVVLIGYRFLMHQRQANLQTIMHHMVVMLCVFGLVMNWNLYEMFVYNIFTGEPEHLTQLLFDSKSKYPTIDALDHIFNTVLDLTKTFLGQVSFSSSGIAFLFYAFVTYIFGTAMCVIALLLFIYAKISISVALSLGPLFILMYLWEPTRGFFSSWLNKLVTLALIPIVTTVVLMIMIKVIHLVAPITSTAAEQQGFKHITAFITLNAATALLLIGVLPICSSLGGGVSLASLSRGFAIARQSIAGAANTFAGGAGAAQWTKSKVDQIRERRAAGKALAVREAAAAKSKRGY